MQTTSIDNIGIISELTFGAGISQAVKQGRRADFALLMSMFSDDVRETTPLDTIEDDITTEDKLRVKFGVAPHQALRSSHETYDRSAHQAKLFHDASLSSSKLSHYLSPEALAFMPENTADLPEEVFQNLSWHERRRITGNAKTTPMPIKLYEALNTAQRKDQIQVQL
ncbi:hypothetical protein BCU68_16485 [Vibrio sp. 10N.286.49.B3]|uniref:VC2046/SO_2500 family protein n=1 Tax=Vibrio sp. 10N.286.49.B3 TaxID=1880855 RepID=UPI000C81AAFD|nr:VC2046/SO_2500 family protein [Vibrio sp. 10N.286.49.B3]PMH39383.1 hypothetical protein BCU68_16485 [Vibrio sp. 10N.286.49.B3]